MSLLNKILSTARKPELSHGIYENCVITKVEASGKKTKDGEAIKRNCFTTFATLNDKGEVIGEKEVSWYDLDVTNEYAKDNFKEQLLQIVSIMECFFDPKDVDDVFNPIFDEAGIVDDATLETVLTDKASLKKLMAAIAANYTENMESVLNDKDNLLRLKLVYDNKGKYVQQPKYGKFVEPCSIEAKDSTLKFSTFELENEAKSRNLTTTSSTTPVNI